MTSGSYDAEVGVVGTGPAGARVAERLAARGVDGDPRAPWEKPCGGGLTAALTDAVPEIAEVLPRARPIDHVCITTDQNVPPLQLELRRPAAPAARARDSTQLLRPSPHPGGSLAPSSGARSSRHGSVPSCGTLAG